MHAAPAVSYPVGRPRVYTRVFVLLWAAAAGMLFVFGSLPSTSMPKFLVAISGASIAFALAWRGWWRCPTGQVAWDGVRWWWRAQGDRATHGSQEGRLQVVLDLQQLILVQFTPLRGRDRWLWLEKRSEALTWGRLRCAVMQPAAAGDSASSAGAVP